MSETFKVYEGVTLAEGSRVEEYCILGVPPRGYSEGELETVIGPDALLRSHTVIYAGNKIGAKFQTGNKVNIREMNVIGSGVSVGTLSIVEHPRLELHQADPGAGVEVEAVATGARQRPALVRVPDEEEVNAFADCLVECQEAFVTTRDVEDIR